MIQVQLAETELLSVVTLRKIANEIEKSGVDPKAKNFLGSGMDGNPYVALNDHRILQIQPDTLSDPDSIHLRRAPQTFPILVKHFQGQNWKDKMQEEDMRYHLNKIELLPRGRRR